MRESVKVRGLRGEWGWGRERGSRESCCGEGVDPRRASSRESIWERGEERGGEVWGVREGVLRVL